MIRIISLLVFLSSYSAVKAEDLTYRTLMLDHFKTEKVEVSTNSMLDLICSEDMAKYNKARNDNFAKHELTTNRLSELKKDLDKFKRQKTYTFNLKTFIHEYEFDKKAFSLRLAYYREDYELKSPECRSYPLDRPFMKRYYLELDQPKLISYIPFSPDKAKEFLESRRGEGYFGQKGKIDYKVFVEYTLALKGLKPLPAHKSSSTSRVYEARVLAVKVYGDEAKTQLLVEKKL